MERKMIGTELATRGAEGAGPTGLDLLRTAPKEPWMMRIEEHPHWETLRNVAVTIRAASILNRFRVRDLLAMKAGQIFETLSPAMEDVPVKVGEMQLGWCEFEVVEQKMAVRLTRLR
jgi:flagellar motor switch protein FliM